MKVPLITVRIWKTFGLRSKWLRHMDKLYSIVIIKANKKEYENMQIRYIINITSGCEHFFR